MDHPHLDGPVRGERRARRPLRQQGPGRAARHAPCAPAIRNAVLNATGIGIDVQPITPHALLRRSSSKAERLYQKRRANQPMYDMKAIYEAHSRGRAPSRPPVWSIRSRRSSPAASDVLVQMREGKLRRSGAHLHLRASTPVRGICIDEDENIRIGSLTSFSHITARPHHPEIHQRAGRGGRHGRRPADPQHRHHRRQHLQRRDLRRLRLHAARMGGHRGADAAKTACAAVPITRTSTSGRARWTCRAEERRDRDGHPHPEGQL